MSGSFHGDDGIGNVHAKFVDKLFKEEIKEDSFKKPLFTRTE